jgi:hypothetical protein
MIFFIFNRPVTVVSALTGPCVGLIEERDVVNVVPFGYLYVTVASTKTKIKMEIENNKVNDFILMENSSGEKRRKK